MTKSKAKQIKDSKDYIREQISKLTIPKRIDTGLINPDKLITEQHHKQGLNVNNIINRYINNGIPLPENDQKVQYGYATKQDFHEAMNLVTKTTQIFDQLPAKVRLKFSNNVEIYLDHMENLENTLRDHLVENNKSTDALVSENPENTTTETEQLAATDSEVNNPLTQPAATDES